MPGTLILKHEVASQVPGEYFNLHLAHRLESVDLEMSLVVPGLHKVRVVCIGLPKLEGTGHLGLGSVREIVTAVIFLDGGDEADPLGCPAISGWKVSSII